jgi:hypothetical protein
MRIATGQIEEGPEPKRLSSAEKVVRRGLDDLVRLVEPYETASPVKR